MVPFNILPNFKWKYWDKKVMEDFAYVQIMQSLGD